MIDIPDSGRLAVQVRANVTVTEAEEEEDAEETEEDDDTGDAETETENGSAAAASTGSVSGSVGSTSDGTGTVSGNGSPGGSGSGGTKSSGGSSSSACDHDWVATKHAEEGHYESVLVSDGYYEVTDHGYKCNVCGYTTQSSSEIGSHCAPGHVHDKGSSYSSYENKVWHDEVYKDQWVVDKAAYTTYKCSKCGATK